MNVVMRRVCKLLLICLSPTVCVCLSPTVCVCVFPPLCVFLVSGHGSWVLSVSPHPSGAAFASGGSDAKVKLWDVGARACVQTVSEHTDQVGETFSERI